MKGKKILLFFLIIFFGFNFFVGCKKIQSIDEVSKNLSNYNLLLSFDDNTKTLYGKQTVDYVNSTDTTLNEVWFHLYANAFSINATTKPVSLSYKQKAYPNGESYGGIEIDSVSVNDEPSQVNVGGVDNEVLMVDLNKDLFPNERVKIYLTYTIVLPNCLHRFGYGDNTYNFGNFYPIACVYENGEFDVDAYGSNGDPFYSDMSNYQVEIICDGDFNVATTGDQSINNVDENNKRKVVATAKAVRDFAFVMSKKFEVISKKAGDTTVLYYYYDDDNAQASLQTGVDSINTFSNLFGKYPYKTMSVVKANFIHGGMEYPNLVYISDSVEEYKDYKNVIIHEVAHQWWYNLVGSNACEYAWLDEGLTEYSTLMFYKENPTYDVNVKESIDASLSSYLLFSEICSSVYGNFNSVMTRNLNTFKGDLEYVYVTYVKGVLFFDNLNELVGSKNFIKSLKLYFKEKCYKNASPGNMINCFEKVCKRSLENYFDSWIQGKVVLQNYSN